MSEPGVIGLISDTHGLLRPQALTALAGSELIVHAGDVGRPEILDELRAVAPVVAVRGNIDTEEWAQKLPLTAVARVRSTTLYVLHDVHDLECDPATEGYAVVVSGHSHKPGRTEKSGVLFINPGSAGPRRFRLPITVARLNLRQKPWRLDFIDLAAGG